MERIFTRSQLCEARVESRDDVSYLSGYGAVFFDGSEETQYRLHDDMIERIDPQAFNRALEEGDDVAGLFNHDANMILARSPNTLKLSADERGLRYEMQLGESSIAQHVREAVGRGDVTGSSFAFVVDEVDWQRGERYDVRLVKSVRLFDVGPVTYPAYKGTSTAVRSLDALRAERAQHIKPKPSYHYRRALLEEYLVD
jgi:HK97 family phage prohead protease